MMTNFVFAVLNDPPCIITPSGRIFAINTRNNQPRKMIERTYNITSCGYAQVNIGGKHYQAHRLVARAFLGECPKGKEVDHINRNKLDNNIKNLRYVTRSENMLNRSYISKIEPGFWSKRTKKAVSTYNKIYRHSLKEKGFYWGSAKIDGKWKTVKQPISNMKRKKDYD